MSMPKLKEVNLTKELTILNYGKEMAMRSIKELSLKDFDSLEDYNKQYKYLKDLMQRIACELESMHDWIRIMNDKSCVNDYLG